MIHRTFSDTDRSIMRLALPAIASNITIPLLGLCDTAITGHLGSELFLAAVAAGGTIFNVILWLCGFLRMGTTGLAAEAFGSGDSLRMSRVFWRAVILAFILGMATVIVRKPLLALFIDIISPGEDVMRYASLYFSICVWGIPPLLLTLSINGWFIGMQNTVVPMTVSIFMNLFNVGASLVAVYGLNLGFAGVAYGTLSANWAGLILAAVMVTIYSRKINIHPDFSNILHGGGFGKFFRVSSDLFFRSACVMGVSLTVTSIGARLGDLTMATNTVMLQFFLFFSYFMDGFSFAGEALVGKNYGANNPSGIRIVIKHLLKWSAAMALIFTIVYIAGSNLITDLLTDISEVKEYVAKMSVFLWILPAIAVWAFIYDGFFIGLTATRRMFLTTLAAVSLFAIIIFAGYHLDIESHNANIILWIAFLTFLAVRGLGLAAQLPHLIRQMEQK